MFTIGELCALRGAVRLTVRHEPLHNSVIS